MNKKDIEEIVRNEIIATVLQTQEFYVVGNWKMNKTKQEVIQFLNEIKDVDFGAKNKVVIIPPNPYLYLFEEALRYSQVQYGAQNLFPKDNGAFTGELSISMVRDFGCTYAIIGHSERRTLFLEDNRFISKKVRSCVQNNIIPILCIGEDLELRKNNSYKQHLVDQIKEGLSRVTKEELSQVVIAYEPIWAIGTGETASPEQVEEVHMFIRKYLVDTYGEAIGKAIPLLYGGSVKPTNIKDLALAESVSGFLIGGASLEAKTLIEMNQILNGK